MIEFKMKMAAKKKLLEDPNADVRMFMRGPIAMLYQDTDRFHDIANIMKQNPYGRKRKVAKHAFNNEWRWGR